MSIYIEMVDAKKDMVYYEGGRFDTMSEAHRYVRNLPASVVPHQAHESMDGGLVWRVEVYDAYIDRHYVGTYETEDEAQVALEAFDRSSLVKDGPVPTN